MTPAMTSLSRPPPTVLTTKKINFHSPQSRKATRHTQAFTLTVTTKFRLKHRPLLCSNSSSPWEPSPITYAPTDDNPNFLQDLESMNSETPPEPVKEVDTVEQPPLQLQPLKWPMWIFGPCILLATGVIPTLWLPLSSVFLGANIASLLSLVGLDCIFNLGATLFLLMADACARPKSPTQTVNSQPPMSYRFWNLLASLLGFLVPLGLLFASHKGLFQSQLPLISFGVLFGPYLLLLLVQILTEMLTWHWQSPVWLMTPIVYEAYRVLQLMRSLKLSVEIAAPMWTVETLRGLVSWWILILGMQLMRVAWFAGFSARARKKQV